MFFGDGSAVCATREEEESASGVLPGLETSLRNHFFNKCYSIPVLLLVGCLVLSLLQSYVELSACSHLAAKGGFTRSRF